jgi:undecaprenyl-diphosphatase
MPLVFGRVAAPVNTRPQSSTNLGRIANIGWAGGQSPVAPAGGTDSATRAFKGIMTNDLFAYLREVDLALFHFINGFAGRSLTLDEIANLVDSLQLKSLALMGTFGALWFQRSKTPVQQRETLILTLLGVVLSIVLARSLADLLQIRPRPMYEPGFRPLLFHRMADFEDWSSFPSDNAAVLFSLTTGFWLVSRGWGLLWACFSVVAVTARIYTGIHYPSDVLAGALVGIGAAFAANNAFTRAHVAAPGATSPRLLLLLLVSFHLRGVDDVHADALAAPGDHAHSLRPRQLVDLRPAHAGLPDPHAELLVAETTS